MDLFYYNGSSYIDTGISCNENNDYIIDDVRTASSGSITERWTLLIDFVNYNNITNKITCKNTRFSTYLHDTDTYSAFIQPSDKFNLLGKTLYLRNNMANVGSGSINITVPYTIISISFT